MPKKRKDDEKQVNFKTIDEIKEELAKKKPKAKFFDYKNDTLATRRADTIELIEKEVENFSKDSIDLKKEFLLALTYGNDIKATAQTMGVARHRIYKLQETDPAFAESINKIKKEFEYEKVKDIENELLETKDILAASYEVLWNNGFLKEAILAINSAVRIQQRHIDRYDERKAREEDLLLFREDDIKAPNELNVNVITQSSTPRKLPNNLTENDGD